MHIVADVLAHKEVKGVLSISASSTAYSAVSLMMRSNVGSILVNDDDHSLLGIFTERDYLRRIVLESLRPETELREVITRRLLHTSPDRTVEECMAVMTNRRIRHLPVIENGRLVGIVSIGDLVKHLASECNVEIKHLTDYITGRYPGEVGAGYW